MCLCVRVFMLVFLCMLVNMSECVCVFVFVHVCGNVHLGLRVCELVGVSMVAETCERVTGREEGKGGKKKEL